MLIWIVMSDKEVIAEDKTTIWRTGTSFVMTIRKGIVKVRAIVDAIRTQRLMDVEVIKQDGMTLLQVVLEKPESEKES